MTSGVKRPAPVETRTCNICAKETPLFQLVKNRSCAGGVRPRCTTCHYWQRKKTRLGLSLPKARPPTGKRAEIEAHWAERRRREDAEAINVTIEGEL